MKDGVVALNTLNRYLIIILRPYGRTATYRMHPYRYLWR